MLSASAAADCVSLDETRRRELLLERIAGPRGPASSAEDAGPHRDPHLETALQLCSSLSGPAAAVLGLAARDKAPATATLPPWCGGRSAGPGWAGSPCLPADSSHIAYILSGAAAGASGHTQTEQRACAIATLSALARVPSPGEDATVQDVHSRLHSTLLLLPVFIRVSI